MPLYLQISELFLSGFWRPIWQIFVGNFPIVHTLSVVQPLDKIRLPRGSHASVPHVGVGVHGSRVLDDFGNGQYGIVRVQQPDCDVAVPGEGPVHLRTRHG